MKTIREWLNELPEDVRDKAIANTDEDILGERPNYPFLRHALIRAFNWDESPEGHVYWYNMAEFINIV